MNSGKTLGGSSSINGATWTRAAKVQYDTMQSLLEPEEAKVGWNFTDMMFYMKKVTILSLSCCQPVAGQSSLNRPKILLLRTSSSA